MRHDGGLLIALDAGLGLLVSMFDFLSPVALLARTPKLSDEVIALALPD
jgi:hypothetical protein